jgi:fumarylpyruvate hydrolase
MGVVPQDFCRHYMHIVAGQAKQCENPAMSYVIPIWNIPSLPVVGKTERFPIRRVFCVGRNYVEHQKEMGGDGREQPFFFAKAAHDIFPVESGVRGEVHYPPMSSDYHWETELVVALGKGGYRIPVDQANEHVFGYAVGLDMTRRDLQQVGKDKGRPWTFGKDFDQAAPMGPLTPAASIGHPTKSALRLSVNGLAKQDSNIDQMIWSVPEQIAFLSQHYTLEAGDLIMTGTPAGVGAAKAGDELVADIQGLSPITVRILPPK